VRRRASQAAAVWVARRKLFGEEPQRNAPLAESQGSPASRRLSAEWDDDDSLLEYADDGSSFASGGSYYRRSPLDESRMSRTPPSAGSVSSSRTPRSVPHTPGTAVRFADSVEFSPAAESVLSSPRPHSEPIPVGDLLTKVVAHLDQTAAHALKTFYKYDSDESGMLSVAQLASVLAELGLRVELEDVRALAEHMGVLSVGSVLDGEVLGIKAFLRALKQARNERRVTKVDTASATEPAPIPAPVLEAPQQPTAEEPPVSVEAEKPASPAGEPAGEQQVEEAEQEQQATRTAWAAATSRDGKPVRPQSASRARPRSQETVAAITRRALDHYDAGCEHLDDGNWTAAEAELRKALTLQPNFPDCQRRLAALKRKQGEDAALNVRQSTLGFTPQLERKPTSVVARARLATPHGVNGPTISSSRKAVGNLVATGRVVPASAPPARWREPGSPQRRAADEPTPHEGPSTTVLGHRMEQLKVERGKEEVVQRLYNWESSKKTRMEEAQQAAAPAFTPQPYAATRRSEYDYAELGEPEGGADLVDRCFEWSHNREEWLKVRCSDIADVRILLFLSTEV
jgi:hypothetical protein